MEFKFGVWGILLLVGYLASKVVMAFWAYRGARAAFARWRSGKQRDPNAGLLKSA